MDINNEYGCLNIQQSLLNLMKIFHEFCDENNVKYSLIGGSLLGTVRDNGFIPWDDDMDVMVDRDNLARIIELLSVNEKLTVHRRLWVYRVQLRNDEGIDGYIPTLDLFAVDNMPDSKFARKFTLLKLHCIQGMIKDKPDYSRFSLKNKILSFATYYMGKPFSFESKMRRYDKHAQKYNSTDTDKKAIFYAQFHQLGFLYPHDMMENPILHVFEDTKVYITRDYDEVLTMTYGDYMTPPKKKDCKPSHH